MVELEVYAAGLRAPEKMLGLTLELDAMKGLRYKVDTAHDLVYMEFFTGVPSADTIRAAFRRVGLQPKFVGHMPREFFDPKKTQRIQCSPESQ